MFVIFGAGLEKTESNCSWISFAFVAGSFVSVLSLFLSSEIPTFSCLLLLMYDHSFLLDKRCKMYVKDQC